MGIGKNVAEFEHLNNRGKAYDVSPRNNLAYEFLKKCIYIRLQRKTHTSNINWTLLRHNETPVKVSIWRFEFVI